MSYHKDVINFGSYEAARMAVLNAKDPEPFATIREEYIGNYGETDVAAIAFARDLMQGDPKNFKRGYTRENAIIAACEVFPECVDMDWHKEILDV
jgi:hypothetical protein